MKFKNYTKYSENSNNTETVEETVQNEEVTEEVIEAVAEAIVEEAKETDKTVEEVVTEIVEETQNDSEEHTGETEMETDNVDGLVEDDVDGLVEDGEELVSHIQIGALKGCAKLNVRKEANKNAEVVCVITKDTEFTVDLVKSTEDFYKVYTCVDEVLYEGFCMKEFINIVK